ncbi:carbohydrate kinase PfkB [Sarracenia purpurea var. burkii]
MELSSQRDYHNIASHPFKKDVAAEGLQSVDGRVGAAILMVNPTKEDDDTQEFRGRRVLTAGSDPLPHWVAGDAMCEKRRWISARYSALGVPTNVAIVVSRLGGRAMFVEKLNDDEFEHMPPGIFKKNDLNDDRTLFDLGMRMVPAFVTLRVGGEHEKPHLIHRETASEKPLAIDLHRL